MKSGRESPAVKNGRKFAVYAISAVVLAAFAPVLPFLYLAAAGVILAGLFLIDLVQSIRRR